MQGEPISIMLTYSDGTGVSFQGQGAIVYTADCDERRLFAVTGQLSLGDVVQLISELMDSFGEEDLQLASSIALVARHMNETENEESV